MLSTFLSATFAESFLSLVKPTIVQTGRGGLGNSLLPKQHSRQHFCIRCWQLWFNSCMCCTLYILLPSPILNSSTQKEGEYIHLKKKGLELVTLNCCNSGVSYKGWQYDWKIQRQQDIYQKNVILLVALLNSWMTKDTEKSNVKAIWVFPPPTASLPQKVV